MPTQAKIILFEPPTRIRILRDYHARDVEPLALEDFSDETPLEDRPEDSLPEGSESVAPPQQEPLFTIEQVQHEVQTAYDRGFSEGQEVATAVLETELRALTERVRSLDSAILELQRQYAQAIERTEHVALDLAATIARAILRIEAERSIECVVAQAQAALAQYHGKDAVTVRLHPADYNALEKAGNPLVSGHDSRPIKFVADPAVEEGGCILETALGSFDAQLSKQLERARSIIAEHLRTPPPSPDEQSNAV